MYDTCLASKRSVERLRAKNILRKFRRNVEAEIHLRRQFKGILRRRDDRILKSHFTLWAFAVSDAKVKIGEMFKIVQKGWKEVGYKRWKRGPHVVGGIRLIKAAEKCEASLCLKIGFCRLKIHCEQGEGIEIVSRVVDGQFLRLAFDLWEYLTCTLLLNYEKQRIGLNKWKRYARRREEEHRAYAAKRLKRFAIYHWNWRINDLKVARERQSHIEAVVEDLLAHKRRSSLQQAMSNLVTFAVERVKARHLQSAAVEHCADRKLQKSMRALRSAAITRRERRAKAKRAIAWHQSCLARKCFHALAKGHNYTR